MYAVWKFQTEGSETSDEQREESWELSRVSWRGEKVEGEGGMGGEGKGER
jgi:hypothetical protein